VTAEKIRPVDVPSLRDNIVEMLRSTRYREQYESVPYRHPAFPANRAIEHEARLFSEATLFLASAEMTDLARQAGKTLPHFGYTTEDLPAKVGLIFFDAPLTAVPHGEPPVNYSVDGWFWAEVAAGRGMLCQPLTRRDKMLQALVEAGVASEEDAAHSRSLMPPVLPMAHRSTFLPYKAVESDHHTRVLYEAIGGLRATWLLMQQPITTTEEDRLDKATRRRFTRTGQEPPTVRVISLRRAVSTSNGDQESDREYHHQWVVRGHWRQQWYPAREVHRPVWIAPHIKGPEGAPVLGGEKVYQLKR
jgi:hypothetical protein